MRRKILLIEPNYKNKYPPIGLMKIATYHRLLKDEVTFYKGEFKDFILKRIYSELIKKLYKIDGDAEWYKIKDKIIKYVQTGHKEEYNLIISISKSSLVEENIVYYKNFYKKKKYLEKPYWDRIYISTLFTFHWKKTIDTINSFKVLCKNKGQVFVGGVAASVLPEKIEHATGIKPWVGLLNRPGVYDDNDIIIDNLPLDYSIIEEIEYTYPENSGYYGYMTRGCVNRCSFCLVPTIEPEYNDYVSIKEQIRYVRERFGEKRNLLLLDNNVLASDKFNIIIDEIKAAGFDKTTMFVEPNKYEISIKALEENFNNVAYIRCVVKLYKNLFSKLNENTQAEVYEVLKRHDLLDEDIASRSNILKTYNFFKPYFVKLYKNKAKKRVVDFNQGLEAKLLTDEKMKKLAEIPINPLRIAFDTWSIRAIYEKAIRMAAKYKVRNMSNYLLYNYNDKPIDLYYRIKLNVELCEELGVVIYSFPMKYHPITDEEYFDNRKYIGKHWNRKYIRAIQAVLNSTKGKIGRGRSFFEEAFGKNEDEFYKVLYMPEVMIIYRMFFKDNGITDKWWCEFNSLSEKKLLKVKEHIHKNEFSNTQELTDDKEILKVLEYYKISRDDAEEQMK